MLFQLSLQSQDSNLGPIVGSANTNFVPCHPRVTLFWVFAAKFMLNLLYGVEIRWWNLTSPTTDMFLRNHIYWLYLFLREKLGWGQNRLRSTFAACFGAARNGQSKIMPNEKFPIFWHPRVYWEETSGKKKNSSYRTSTLGHEPCNGT